MKILGIDYGRKKIGLALSTEGKLATPLKVLRLESLDHALLDIKEIYKKEKIDQIVIGVSEGKTAEETKNFAKELEKTLGTSVNYQDETLTTKDAQLLSINAGIKRSKRKEMEDAYSATLILQEYLDSL